MFKILLIIQLGSQSHSSQVLDFDKQLQADDAFDQLKLQKTAYNITAVKLY